MRRVRVLALLAVTFASGIAAADTYRFTDLPQSVQGYQVFPGAINDSGDLLLNGDGPNGNAIFIRDGQKLRLVQTGSYGLRGTALTNNGTVGASTDGNVLFTIKKNGKMTTLPVPPVSGDVILGGLNERGDYLLNAGLFGNANFLGRKDMLSQILVPGFSIVYATGLSEDGTFAGFVQNGSPGNPSMDFVMHDKKIDFFTVPFAQAAWPTCLSHNARFVAGAASVGGANTHGFVREKNGTLSDLAYPFPATRVVNGNTETLRFAQTGITGVNSKGEVCGRAFALYDGAFVDSSIVGFVAKPEKRP